MEFLYSKVILAKILGIGDTTFKNCEAKLTLLRRKLVQLLQQVHCEPLK